MPPSDSGFLRDDYDGAELRTNPPRGPDRASKLPSRYGDTLVAHRGVRSLNSADPMALDARVDEVLEDADV